MQVFVDGVEVGAAYRADCPQAVHAPAGARMALLVENMGRINYGEGAMYDYKGLLAPPPVAGNWSARCLPLRPEQVSALPFSRAAERRGRRGGPVFRRGTLHAGASPQDTFLDTAGLSKGIVWINGVSLGRYWEVGPQHTLYLPAPFLRPGANEVIVLDLHGAEPGHVRSVAAPRYSHRVKDEPNGAADDHSPSAAALQGRSALRSEPVPSEGLDAAERQRKQRLATFSYSIAAVGAVGAASVAAVALRVASVAPLRPLL